MPKEMGPRSFLSSLLFLSLLLLVNVSAFSVALSSTARSRGRSSPDDAIALELCLSSSPALSSHRPDVTDEEAQQNLSRSPRTPVSCTPSRRYLLLSSILATTAGDLLTNQKQPAWAGEEATIDNAEVTDRVYFALQGLPSSPSEPKRVVIGLFGKQAPQSVRKLKQLFSPSVGLPAPCRPRAVRTLEKEQLQANKVYNTCKTQEATGVSLQYSTVWRIVPNERIDVGDVAGKFVAREYPSWSEDQSSADYVLRHSQAGVVSVRRGNEGGFGFTIYPGSGDKNFGETVLDDQHIIVGRVLEGMDVVRELNTKVPVITTSSQLNFMALAGGGSQNKAAPSRACTYGGPMYCNENKPLIKLSLSETGVL